MYRELIHTLTYMYSIVCRGKGHLEDTDLRHIADGAHTLTKCAPAVETLANEETPADKAYLKEAQKIDEQIEEMTCFLLNLEIC